MKCAIYCRVSTEDQSIDTQSQILIDYCKSKNWSYEVFTDHGISGAKRNRPALDRILERLEEFDCLAVYKLDRLGRSASHLLSLLEVLQKANVEFVCTDQGIDTSTSAGRLLFGILATVAQFERDLISERTKATMKQASKRGVKFGRKRQVDHQVIKDALKEHCVETVAEMYSIHPQTVRKIRRAA